MTLLFDSTLLVCWLQSIKKSYKIKRKWFHSVVLYNLFQDMNKDVHVTKRKFTQTLLSVSTCNYESSGLVIISKKDSYIKGLASRSANYTTKNTLLYYGFLFISIFHHLLKLVN